MAHLSLYRKYRPATFEDVKGQDHVTRTLRNAIDSGKISHAYLFAGSRGTGKTSVAKLLAKALNCVEGPTANPCGVCESCVAIGAGTSLDVVEMDAASNRGIDDIRDIRDKVAFSPVEGKSRVYILDEAHMLTKEASNAFLKVLEEPPGHVIFVLCTTEAHKVLPTIQSRCQRFEFRRPDVNMVQEVLGRIAGAEELDIDEAGLAAIARTAGGSFRDAVGILEQLSTYCEGRVSVSDVFSFLGVVESDLLFEIVDIIAESDARGALLFVNRLAENGRDYGQFASELIGHLRNIFLLQQLDDYPGGIINAPEEDYARLKAQARQLSPGQVLRFVELLAKAQTEIKQGAEARLQLEMAFVVMARPEADMSTKSMLHRLDLLEERMQSQAGKPGARTGNRPGAKEPAGGKHGTGDETLQDENPPEADGQKHGIEVSLDKIRRAWSIILLEVKKRKIPLHSLLQEAKPMELDGKVLVVGFTPGSDFHKAQAEKPEYAAVLADVLGEMTGEDLKVRYIITEGASSPEKIAPTHDEVVAMIKKEFKAEEIE